MNKADQAMAKSPISGRYCGRCPMENEPTWATGTRSKHWRESGTVLLELLSVAWGCGYCSANDIRSRELITESNVIGAVFKQLRKCGLEQTETRVAPQWQKAHSRPLYIWQVKDHDLLESKIKEIKALLGVVAVDANGQERLAL